MTMTWAIDPVQYDLVINKAGTIQTTYGTDEVRQRIIITLLHLWQEYFLDVPGGLPWYQIMLGSKDPGLIETLVQQAILDVPNVLSILSLQITPIGSGNRSVQLSAQVEVQGLQAPSIIDIVQEMVFA